MTIEDGQQGELDTILHRVVCLLQFRSPEGLWHARLKEMNWYGHGETPLEAVYDALQKQQPAPRRRRVVVPEPAPRRRPTQGGFFG